MGYQLAVTFVVALAVYVQTLAASTAVRLMLVAEVNEIAIANFFAFGLCFPFLVGHHNLCR